MFMSLAHFPLGSWWSSSICVIQVTNWQPQGQNQPSDILFGPYGVKNSTFKSKEISH